MSGRNRRYRNLGYAPQMGDGIDLSSILGSAGTAATSTLEQDASSILPSIVAATATSALQQSGVQQAVQQSALQATAASIVANKGAWIAAGIGVIALVYFLAKK